MFNKESLLKVARQRLVKREDAQKVHDYKENEAFEGVIGGFFERKKTALLNKSLPAVFIPLVTETRDTIEQKEGVQLDENWRYYFYIPEGGNKVYDTGYGYPRKHYYYQRGGDFSKEQFLKLWTSGKLDKTVKMGVTIELTGRNEDKHEEMFVSFDYDETSRHVALVVGSHHDWVKRRDREWDGREKTFNEFTEDLANAIDGRNYAFRVFGAR